METIFQIGDVVEHVVTGEIGECKDAIFCSIKIIVVRYRCGKECKYTVEGKSQNQDKYPSIRLISRQKKKVKKEVIAYLYRELLNQMKYDESFTEKHDDKIPITLTWEEEES